ncbi:hypothetical protein F5X98DRAFT_386463 [Xylaria grammica]|nr:hypothetical protein F5X98DRAFT_386463 [Xylaria grammica]
MANSARSILETQHPQVSVSIQQGAQARHDESHPCTPRSADMLSTTPMAEHAVSPEQTGASSKRVRADRSGDNEARLSEILLEDQIQSLLSAALGMKTPLHLAIDNRGWDIVTRLLDKGVDVNAQDVSGWTALHLACQNGRVDIARKLFDKEAVSRVQGSDNIHGALYFFVQYFWDNPNANPDPKDAKLIWDKADLKERVAATYWAKGDKDWNHLASLMQVPQAQIEEYTLIRLAKTSTKSDTDQILDILRDKGGNLKCESALECAAYYGLHNVVWWLLKNSMPSEKAETERQKAENLARKRHDESKNERTEEATKRQEETRGKQAHAKTEDIKSVGDKSNQKRTSGLRKGESEFMKPQFDVTIDMLMDPPPVEGASTDLYEETPRDSELPKQELDRRWATIVDFYQRNGRVDLLRRSRSIFDVVYNKISAADNPAGPEAIMQKARSASKGIRLEVVKERDYEKKDLRMRWIHLPANNMEWMEASLQREEHELIRLALLERFSAKELKESTLKGRGTTEQRERQHAEQEAKGSEGGTANTIAKDGEPTEQHNKGRGDAKTNPSTEKGAPESTRKPDIYERVAPHMPYITFAYCHRKDKSGQSCQIEAPQNELPHNQAPHNQRPRCQTSQSQLPQTQSSQNDVSDSRKTYEELLKAYPGKTIHGTRSLDQFYYNSLPDMDERDQNQVFMRSWFGVSNGDGVPKHLDKWPYLAVDQLWLWANARWSLETIITSSTHRQDGFIDPVIEMMFRQLRDAKTKKHGQPPPSSVKEMSRFLVLFCVDFINSVRWKDFSESEKVSEQNTGKNPEKEAVSKPAADEKDLSHDFMVKMKEKKGNRGKKKKEDEEIKHPSEEPKPDNDTKNENKTTDKIDKSNWTSVSRAAALLDEVKDILDELMILKTLVTQQGHVWQDLVGNDLGPSNSRGPVHTLRAVTEMIEMADRIQASVKEILGLEQNGINIDQANESARQGTILMAFTLVTVFFTPLSFLTSLFALNVTVFQRNSSGQIEYQPGWIFTILFTVTTGVFVPVAMYVFRDQGRRLHRMLDKLSEKWMDFKGSRPPITDEEKGHELVKPKT